MKFSFYAVDSNLKTVGSIYVLGVFYKKNKAAKYYCANLFNY